jgi:O-methyltransferase involved in polyketide biosynthesis
VGGAEAARIEPGGVAETLLWTLYHRAAEARRPDGVLDDPRAVRLVDGIDFPFGQRFGAAAGAWSQWQALRARAFDGAVRRFLAAHPDGTVVALGEGLETTYWRVDNGRVRWLSVDLPEALELRTRLLPRSERQRLVAASATDERWLDLVDTRAGTLVTAQGLLMYLQPSEVHDLVARCAARLPGGSMVFDAVPSWLARQTQRRRLGAEGGYRPPPWAWGLDRAERRRLAATPNVVDLRELRMPRGRGALFGAVVPAFARVPLLHPSLLRILVARFGDTRA